MEQSQQKHTDLIHIDISTQPVCGYQAKPSSKVSDVYFLVIFKLGQGNLWICFQNMFYGDLSFYNQTTVPGMYVCPVFIVYLYSAQYIHTLQDSKRYLTHLTSQVQTQLTSN